MSTKFYVGQKDYIAKLNEIDDLLQGVQGEPGQGVPVGGTVGQVLSKSGEADYATAWIAPPSSGREILTASRTYYVRKDGSDSNNGLADTAAGAFLTIQAAVNLAASLDLGSILGRRLVIRVGNGVYEESVSLPPLVGLPGADFSGFIASLVGDEATPDNVVIYAPINGAFCVAVSNNARWRVSGVTPNSSRVPFGFFATAGGYLSLGAYNLVMGNGYGLRTSGAGSRIQAWDYTPLKIAGNCKSVAYASDQSSMDIEPSSFEFVGNVAVSQGFLQSDGLSSIVFYNYGVVGAGTCTGSRYAVSLNSIVYTFEGGATHIPGSTPGSATTGGVYS